MSTCKGNKVELKTFLNWGKEQIIGYKTIKEADKVMVNFVWCKICARYKTEILGRLRGKAKTVAASFLDGTNNVTKFSVSPISFFFLWYNYVFSILISFLLYLSCRSISSFN